MQAVRTVDHAAIILYELGGMPAGVGVRDMARRVGLTKSTVQRIMATLEARGLLARAPGTERYQLGAGVVRLAATVIERGETIALATPLMSRLRDETGETVCLHTCVELKRVTLAQVESQHELRWIQRIGLPLSMLRGASGNCLLASLPASQRALVFEHEDVRDVPGLTDNLDRIRKAGWAMSRGDRVPGGTALSAPVPLDDGPPLVIGVCGPDSRMTQPMIDQALPRLLRAVQQVAEVLRFGIESPR
ncbi:MAG: IclR family transcriptional regulator [Chloroflexota bacterium]